MKRNNETYYVRLFSHKDDKQDKFDAIYYKEKDGKASLSHFLLPEEFDAYLNSILLDKPTSAENAQVEKGANNEK